MAVQSDIGVPLSTLCPKFLHTNSTSHTWPFSAIAELIDNAFDPDVNAKQLWIDKTVVQEQDCLIFMDSGNGLNLETMHKMLSFGYSEKTAMKGVKPIGMYGNGFKSGAMRLGKDAIVFSKSKDVSCIGMLSQTYLEEIGAKQIVVPIICFTESGTNSFSVSEEQKASLQHILRYSPFKTQKKLLDEINAITSLGYAIETGTRIIIWNLRRTSTRPTEFDFEIDRYDIRIPSDVYEEINDTPQYPGRPPSHIPETAYSLRAYCRILYLKPRMQINIRGVKVKSQLIVKSLAFVRKDCYKPAFMIPQSVLTPQQSVEVRTAKQDPTGPDKPNHKPIPIHFGYNTKSKDQYGVMMYHKNRLIKAYERVGCQLKANNKGVGVIGVIECGDFLEPTHNKQSFNETDKYRKTITNLGIKLEEYWHEIRHRRQTEDPNNQVPVEDSVKKPDQNWAQCDGCSRWRKLPDGIDTSKLPEKWFCHMNPDPQFRSCSVEEEAEDSDDDQQAYRKTYKSQTLRKNEEMRRQKDEEEQRQKMREVQLRMRIMSKRSPSTATTPKVKFNSDSVRGGAARAKSSNVTPSYMSQAACSSPSSSGLPVISSVCSLSTPTVRTKRTQPVTPKTTPKRPRTNGVQRSLTYAPTLVDHSPQSSPSVPINDDDGDETDDDIFILETASTLKPKKTGFDLNKVKKEQEQSDANVSMLMECSDDDAVDETNEAASTSAENGPSTVPPSWMSSSTTQTETPKFKEEIKETQTEAEERGQPSVLNEREKDKSGNMEVDVCSIDRNPVRKEEPGLSCAEAADNKPSPAQFPSMFEVQEQQDQLLELMQSTAQERDSLKDQVHELTYQLQDAQTRLQELTQVTVKKESSHQACQTEDGDCYRSLFEKAKEKVDELIKEKERLLVACESKPSTSRSGERDLDEIAVQVDALLRELEERNKERDELQSQLANLEEERANLASKCEGLRLRLQQQQQEENAQQKRTSPHTTANFTAQTDSKESVGGASSLIELRHNIGRLLIHHVPALDLSQVNYDCNVIDEILEQVLCNEGSNGGHMGLEDKSINR